ncbi:glycerophosphodiester phosphodiesterase 1 [Bacillus rossius redtenbacheri]|uniref:glycerophosphodiester phosphodiesterase 1 n=1 Tax=Bacillus rossius redtenbacheri TaxID=93214 RepID=UPI002FDE64E8
MTLTADEVAIIFHDDTTERVAGQGGLIRHMSWDETKELDIAATHPFSEKFKNERIPTFEETLVDCIQNDIRMFIDIKLDDLKLSSLRAKDNKLVQVILDAYNRHPELYKLAVVSSFNPIIIYLIRRVNPGIVCSLAYRPQFFSYESYTGQMGGARPRYSNLLKHLAAQALDTLHLWMLEHLLPGVLGLSAILLHKDLASPDAVTAWQNRGLRVILWTVNMPLEKKYASSVLKVTYMTDTLLGTADELKPATVAMTAS